MLPGKELLLGLDVGTTATKAVVFDVQGRRVAAATRGYDLLTPQPGWVEQDPEALWQAVAQAVRDLHAQLSPEDRIVALSLAAQGGTTIPVDAAGTPRHNAISWMDQRGAATVARARADLGAEDVMEWTGWPLGPTLPLQHIAWLRDQRPDTFRRTARFLFVNDFVIQRLTSTPVMDPSDATMTQLFDIATGTWSGPLLDYVGITPDRVSEIRPSGAPIAPLSPDAAQALGLTPDVIVVNGAHDQYCAAVGTGVTRPGKVLLSCGTAWVLLTVPGDLTSGRESGMAISCHAVPNRWGAIRSLGGVGTSLEWLRRQMWQPDSAAGNQFAALNAAAAGVSPGAEGLFFVPLAGGHTMESAGGGFLRLTIAHTRAEMARAAMEGVAYELRWALDEIESRGLAVDELVMVGGAAESPIWPKIVSDVTGLPVALPAERQAAALGAAILAGVGAGVFRDAEAGYEACRSDGARLAPDPAAQAVYDRAFADYRNLYTCIAAGAHRSPVQAHKTDLSS